MSGSPTINELPNLINKGLQMVEERLRWSNGAPIYYSIKAQLTYIKNSVEAGENVDKLLLGVYAAREFETSDSDFADVLFAVEYLFKRL